MPDIDISLLGGPIKAAYETEPDTNALNDEEEDKLALISVTEPIDLDTIGANTLTIEQLQDHVAAMLIGGTHVNVSVSYNDATGFLDLTSITLEQFQDTVGAMLSGAHTNVTVSYDDTTGQLTLAAPAPGLAEVAVDTSPTLGGNLSLGGFSVGDATPAHLTKLSLIADTVTPAEINRLDGVTAPIQGQIDAVVATANGAIQFGAPIVVRTVGGTSLTLAVIDIGKLIEFTSNTPVAVTIPANVTVAIPINAVYLIDQVGTGVVSVTGATDVIVNGVASGTKATPAQFGKLSIRQRAANVWVVG